ncbi:MAG: transglutaminase family protein [Acidobacteria bacterium]|nr:transglutaminase family protein [Acidobacteriota bacterium]
MKFRVSHQTHYTYSEPVELQPHIFRMLPRGNGSQRVTGFELRLDPAPAGFSEGLDAANNGVHYAWWESLTTRLSAYSSFEVETLRANPYDFLLPDPAFACLPATYPDPVRTTLAPYCVSREPNGAAHALAKSIAQETSWDTLAFLSAFNRRLYRIIEHITRDEGAPLTAEATLQARRGACRDTAVVFIEGCRAMGLAARFVSGYELIAAQAEEPNMHAWAEVYLPGGGWRGYDPSRGLAVAETHIAVAAGLTPQMAAPVTGSFRGPKVDSSLSFELSIEAL